MPLLGLLNTEDYSSQRFTNIRRKVFYHWPNGAAPLTGLLSLMDGETTNDPEYSWWEKRLPAQKSTTASIGGSNGPFGGSGATANNSWGTTARTGGAGIGTGGASTLNDKISIKVADSTPFHAGHVILLRGVNQTVAADIAYLRLRVSAVATNWLDCELLQVVGAASDGLVNSDTSNVGLEVLIIGTSYQQGATGVTEEVYTLPIQPSNYLQIFRTPFSLTGTAMKTSAKFDDTGLYKDKAKEHSIQHMIELEKAFLFGQKLDNVVGGVPQYYTGGVLSFLEAYEAAASIYRGAASTAVTADTDDDKRIIANASGTLNHKTYNGYLERVFRVTNNVANEKLVLCGSGFLSVINQMYADKTSLTNQQGSPSTYGMNVVTHDTPFGTIHYKTHPLFSHNSALRHNALFLDVQNLKYRYLDGRDTQLLKNRQNNGDDFRRDEWLTEAGLELRFPESHMYLQNVLNYTP